MAERVALRLSDNIISPLGFTTDENLSSAMNGTTKIRRHEGTWGIPEPFAASLIDEEELLNECEKTQILGNYTDFEKLAILSIKKALDQCGIDAASRKTLFIISTTKGNIDLLRENKQQIPSDRLHIGSAAKAIASYFGNENLPIVVSNACISGTSAQITASRLIAMGIYDHIIVCGAEKLNPFIISGFQSLKLLSPETCRPFDEERTGINLGDAAATIIFKGVESDHSAGDWHICSGAIRNDAFHISSPSKSAEGYYKSLLQVLEGEDLNEIAFINAHGTATLFNDEMEAVAIDRAGLGHIPINSLKGYWGHTLGAAGVLESIISMHALDHHIIIGTKGFHQLGVSRPVNMIGQTSHTDKKSFIKMISGFGGCNAAILYKKKL